ncbi:MAG TPA: hypothetical protein VIM73_16840 [Polyangiaceae bacterium]
MKSFYVSRFAHLERLIRTDVTVSTMQPETRRTLGSLWAHRAQAELTASAMFSGLALDCSRGNVSPVLLSLTERAVDDERYHSMLSAQMAEHYLGETIPAFGPSADALRFETCEADLALGLRLLLQCALNETVAAAYLRECHREAISPLVRAAVRELLRDEIDHARIGWAYLGSTELGPRFRDSVRRELPQLLAMVSAAWHKPLTESEYPVGYGVLSLERTREVADMTLETLVKPGLAGFGLVDGHG